MISTIVLVYPSSTTLFILYPSRQSLLGQWLMARGTRREDLPTTTTADHPIYCPFTPHHYHPPVRTRYRRPSSPAGDSSHTVPYCTRPELPPCRSEDPWPPPHFPGSDVHEYTGWKRLGSLHNKSTLRPFRNLSIKKLQIHQKSGDYFVWRKVVRHFRRRKSNCGWVSVLTTHDWPHHPQRHDKSLR